MQQLDLIFSTIKIIVDQIYGIKGVGMSVTKTKVGMRNYLKN